MDLARKLKEWEAAGLIDASLHARLLAHEQTRARPVLLYALGGLGAFTVGIGIVSIVAANWEEMGRLSKLFADLTIALALAGALYWSAFTGRHWQTDVLAGIYYVFTLASIALLGQIYQLGSPTHQALLVWSLLTVPFMTLVRGRFLGLVWLSGLATTTAFLIVGFIEELDATKSLGETALMNLALTLLALAWGAHLAVACAPRFSRARPRVAEAWVEALWTVLLLLGATACLAFYSAVGEHELLTWGAGCAALVLGLVHLLLPRLHPNLPVRAQRGLRVGLLLIALIFLCCGSFPRPELPALAALLHVLLLSVAAFVLLQLGLVRSFNTLTGLIALRVLIMYFEVFGSMLDTGLGMISGGVLTLLLAWLWKRKSPEFAARFRQPPASSGVTHGA